MYRTWRLNFPTAIEVARAAELVSEAEQAKAGQAARVDEDMQPSCASGEYDVGAVLGRRTRQGDVQYRVRWKGHSQEADTWEPAFNLTGSQQMLAAFCTHERRVNRRSFIGRRVRKMFQNWGIHEGRCVSYDTATCLFDVRYDDGDIWSCTLAALEKIVQPG